MVPTKLPPCHTNTLDETELEKELIYTKNQLLSDYEAKSSELKQSSHLLDELSVGREKLDRWLKKHGAIDLISSSLNDQVIEINDRVLRFRLFKLATHYWEARWILETEKFLQSDDKDKKSPIKVLRKLRRFAKLTPCFVSTFYRAPSVFMAGEYNNQVWRDLPLFSEIDLLIVDEAGQTVPNIAAAGFALAKKALIVGDTDQIEPVWTLPASIDRGNLKHLELLNIEEDYDDFWLKSGLLTSSGNLMKVAQRQCHYHQFETLQRGLYLTEHRRCYDSIIEYCNDLVYKGELIPLRGEPKQSVPWGTMTMISVSSPSESFGGSRGNRGEAKAIARWLKNQESVILKYARSREIKWQDQEDKDVLRQSVGVVTPFKKQAELIKRELSAVGITKLTVGTVHSLQGDERLLILFSSVYGQNDKSLGKFYDKGSNMLNVAVSRAKDAFIVFGDPDVFGSRDNGCMSGEPSWKLRRLLK